MTYRGKNVVRSGYTIIEILLVVMIIALLASIVLVNAGTWKINAQRSAVMTEVGNALRSIEGCMLAEWPLYCGGTSGNRTSSSNCSGQPTNAPVSGTALCGDTVSEFSQNNWPDVTKNGFTYAGAAGSDIVRGSYTVGVFRDVDGNGLPDDNTGICCSTSGCTEETIAADVGTYCRILANMSGLED